MAFSPDGLLATADGDGTARIWNPVTGQLIEAFAADTSSTGGPVYGVAFSADGLLATAEGNGTARLWNIAADQADPAIDMDSVFDADSGGAIKEMTFSPRTAGFWSPPPPKTAGTGFWERGISQMPTRRSAPTWGLLTRRMDQRNVQVSPIPSSSARPRKTLRAKRARAPVAARIEYPVG